MKLQSGEYGIAIGVVRSGQRRFRNTSGCQVDETWGDDLDEETQEFSCGDLRRKRNRWLSLPGVRAR